APYGLSPVGGGGGGGTSPPGGGGVGASPEPAPEPSLGPTGRGGSFGSLMAGQSRASARACHSSDRAVQRTGPRSAERRSRGPGRRNVLSAGSRSLLATDEGLDAGTALVV